MANLLLIDDHPDLLPDQVSHVFPAPAHRVDIAHTGAEGLNVSPTFGRTSFSSTCACPTSPAWTSCGSSARSTPASRSSWSL